MQILGIALLVIFAGMLVEGAVEFLVSPIKDIATAQEAGVRRKAIVTAAMQWVSALAGIGVAYTFNLSLFCWASTVAGIPCGERLTGSDNLITGIVVGRGSNYAHALIMNLLAKTQADKARVVALK